MISEFEFFHGVAFARMLHATQRQLSIKTYSPSDNAAYVVDGTKGIYIKYSSKRLSPWRFSFQQRHQDKMLEMKKKIGAVFLILVCNDDGLVVLTFEELRQVLDDNHEAVEWISASRIRRQMYSIKGSDGKLSFKVGRDEFLGKLFGSESLM
jgi:penicillin-binding protein-related factor A (putative recombinase)